MNRLSFPAALLTDVGRPRSDWGSLESCRRKVTKELMGRGILRVPGNAAKTLSPLLHTLAL